jgi:hypothetical protein
VRFTVRNRVVAFTVALAGIYALAGIAWLAINPDQRVESLRTVQEK